MNIDLLRSLAVWVPVLLISVIAHEIAHGYAALTQGDPTAKQLGRLSWNPIRHIDPFLTILLPMMMLFASNGAAALGGAKPVPVNPANYRELRKGDIIVSLAGVATNLLIAVISAIVIVAIGIVAVVLPDAALPILGYLQALAYYGIFLNWILIIFNLLPIPPLDGSHVVKYLMPPAMARQYVEIGSRFGFLILIALVFFWRGGMSTLLYPAIVMARMFQGPTQPFWLPEAGAWLP